MCKFLYSFNNAKFALLNQLNIDKTSPLDNNGFFYINRKRPNDEDLEDEHQFSHTHRYRVHHLLRIPRVDTIQTADISSYKV